MAANEHKVYSREYHDVDRGDCLRVSFLAQVFLDSPPRSRELGKRGSCACRRRCECMHNDGLLSAEPELMQFIQHTDTVHTVPTLHL